MVGQFGVVRVDTTGRTSESVWLRVIVCLELGECSDGFCDIPRLCDHASDGLSVVYMMMVSHVVSLVVRSIFAVGGKRQGAVVLLYADLDRDIIPGDDSGTSCCLRSE